VSLPDCGTAFERSAGAGDVDLPGQNGAVASAPRAKREDVDHGVGATQRGGIGGLLAVCDLNDTPGPNRRRRSAVYLRV
jgi:hypothetical protein